jgi:hypothetical protein
MSLILPSYVETIDFHEAVQLAPTKSNMTAVTKIESSGQEDWIKWEEGWEGGVYMGYDDYLSDGLHLKDPTYAIMYKLVMDRIASRWPEIQPENMTMPVPWWGECIRRS